MDKSYDKDLDLEALPVPEEKYSAAQIITTSATENGIEAIGGNKTLRERFASLKTRDAWIGDYVSTINDSLCA